MAQPALHPELSPLDPYDPGRSLFARLGAILLPVAVLIAALGVRLDSWIALPGWLRGGLFLAVGMTIGLAIWGWITLRPRRLGLALAATGLAAASIIVLPDLGRILARFVVPWYTSPVPATRIIIPYPEPVVARGQSTSIVAYLEGDAQVHDVGMTIDIKTNANDAASNSFAISPDSRGLYRYSWNAVVEPITYRLHLGTHRTDWYTITPVDPVELQSESTVEIRGADSSGARLLPLRDQSRLSLIAGDELKFDLQFTRSPAAVHLEWQPRSRFDEHSSAKELIPLALSAAGTRGTATWSPPQSGELRLLLLAEFEYPTEYRLNLNVKPARTTGFATVDGLSRFLQEIDPQRPPRITATIPDQLPITDPVLELRHGSPGRIVTIPGERAANTILFPLHLPPEIQESDQIEVRLTATIPPKNNVPSTIHYPATTWLPLRVQRAALDPVEQETIAAQAWLDQKLHDQRKRLMDSLSIIRQIRAESDLVSEWTIDHSVRVKSARDELAQVATTSRAIADEFWRMPTWTRWSRELESWADTEIAASETALQRWSRHADHKQSRAELARAEQRLTQGVDRLDQLILATNRIAAIRVTARQLQRIREDLATTEKVDFVPRVVAAVRANPVLTAAMERLRVEEKLKLADELDQTLKEQQQLHSAILRTEAEHRTRLLQPIVSQQQALLSELETLRTATALPLQLASSAPLSTESGLLALRHLQAHQLSATLAEQEKTARELDRIDTVLAKAVAARSDHREAVRQLAVWQSRIRTRLADAAETRPQTLTQLAQEQQGIAATLAAVPSERLPQPITTQLSAAVLSTKQADEAFRTSRPNLVELVSTAEQTLRTLADSFPSNADRWRTSRTVLEQLRRQHRGTIADLEQLKPDHAEPQRIDLAKRIQQLANDAESLDVPNLGHRRHAAAAMYLQASADLSLGHLTDAAVSLRQAGRHLDRLAQSLDGKTPEDERARELASLQSDLAESFAMSPTAVGSDRRKSTVTVQLELARQFQSLSAAEAIPQLEHVREATRRAGQLANSASAEELIPAVREAASAARQLADSLTGVESDFDRAKRLAAKLEQLAEQVRQRPPAASGPREVSRILLELRNLTSDFERTRAGRAQASRAAAAIALQQLRDADPSRPDSKQYRAAAETFRRLADEMAGQPESARSEPLPVAKPESDPGQTSPAGTLPRHEEARQAERLAEQQRRLRDTLSQLNATLALGFSPGDGDPIAKLMDAIESKLSQLRLSQGRLSDKQSELSQLVPELRRGDPAALARLASLLEKSGTEIGFDLPLRDTFPFALNHPPVEILAARQAQRQIELVTKCQKLLAKLERDDPFADEPDDDEREGARSAMTALRAAIREMQSAQRAGYSARQRELAAVARTGAKDHLDIVVEKLRSVYHDAIEKPPIPMQIRTAATELRSAVNEAEVIPINRHLHRAIAALEAELTGTK